MAGYDSPSAGQVTIAGKDLINMKGSEIEKFHREEIGFVWQQASRNLFPYLTSLENVALPMLLSTTSDSERKNRSEHLLNMVGMEHRSNHIPDQLSGGEQQRVAIAVGLANDPSLILADEPTGELDDRTASEILDLFGKVNQESKTTIVIVTHNMHHAALVSDKTVFFWLGELIEFDETTTIFTRPSLQRTEDYITGRFG